MRRYHHKVFFSNNVGKMLKEFIENLGAKEIEYKQHATIERCLDKRATIPQATKEILFHPKNTLVEFYEILTTDGVPTARIQKLVIRVHHLSNKFDYTYVIAREGFVISNWANDKNDDHRLTHTKDYYYPLDKVG